MITFFRTLQSSSHPKAMDIGGAIPPNFCGQIILVPPIPLKQQLEAEGETHLCGNQSQSLGKAESLIPQFYISLELMQPTGT